MNKGHLMYWLKKHETMILLIYFTMMIILDLQQLKRKIISEAAKYYYFNEKIYNKVHWWLRIRLRTLSTLSYNTYILIAIL